MKAYITSIGERTTDICKWQLERLGFDTVLLDKKESWERKYRKFIETANEDCWRIDADVIVNKKIKKVSGIIYSTAIMIQFKVFDFYKNDIHIGQPIFYKKEAIDIIKKNIDEIRPDRPEASAWRLEEINPRTYTDDTILGMHGFFQDKETRERARENKIARKQIDDFDFELVEKLYENQEN
jgi:hypothetical protein